MNFAVTRDSKHVVVKRVYELGQRGWRDSQRSPEEVGWTLHVERFMGPELVELRDPIVEVTWNEPAPNDVESLDDATMHVVRRFAVRGREENGVLGIEEIEAIAPKAWEVSDALVACVDGRSDLLSGESATADGRCIVVARGGHISATGESIRVVHDGADRRRGSVMKVRSAHRKHAQPRHLGAIEIGSSSGYERSPGIRGRNDRAARLFLNV